MPVPLENPAPKISGAVFSAKCPSFDLDGHLFGEVAPVARTGGTFALGRRISTARIVLAKVSREGREAGEGNLQPI
jgi:hypothetical protein